MKRSCKLASLVIALVVAAQAQAVPNYRAVILDSTPFAESTARAIANGVAAGGANFAGGAPLVWSDPAGPPVDLTPGGYQGQIIYGADAAGRFVGMAGSLAGGGHAALWTTAAPGAFVDLHPHDGVFTDSYAMAVAGTQQVGFALSATLAPHAFLWTGTAASAVDLTPAGYALSIANGTDGVHQVGVGHPSGPYSQSYDHALMWSGTADSVIDLTPAGFQDSAANGIAGGQQVGSAAKGSDVHAILWFGSAVSYVDLTPLNSRRAGAYATNGTYQVGYAGNAAALWAGSAASWVDLNALLPPAYQGGSAAFAIDADGNVAGYCLAADGYHAVVWLVPEPSSVIILPVAAILLARRRSTS